MSALALRAERLAYAMHHVGRGRKILIVVQLAAQVRPLILWADVHKRPGERVSLGSGREALRNPETGGEILFAAAGALGYYMRGQTFDLILVGGNVVPTPALEETFRLLTQDSSSTTAIIREDPK